jgi:hypothetical protein
LLPTIVASSDGTHHHHAVHDKSFHGLVAGRDAGLTGRGHVIHLKRDMMSASSAATMTVPMKPPMKPSQVFFGESLISGVRPKKKPADGTQSTRLCHCPQHDWCINDARSAHTWPLPVNWQAPHKSIKA